eukprot:sb/3474568/
MDGEWLVTKSPFYCTSSMSNNNRGVISLPRGNGGTVIACIEEIGLANALTDSYSHSPESFTPNCQSIGLTHFSRELWSEHWPDSEKKGVGGVSFNYVVDVLGRLISVFSAVSTTFGQFILQTQQSQTNKQTNKPKF